jgi:hypothetical protein
MPMTIARGVGILRVNEKSEAIVLRLGGVGQCEAM